MHNAVRFQVLHGPYTAPALRRGDRATCHFRDADVIVTGWSDGRIPWPRCRLPGTHGGGSGLLVDEELARAVRSESKQAVMFWWGVSASAVFNWRRVLGVERFNEGSKRLHDAAAVETGRKTRGRKLHPEQVERRRRTAQERDLGQYLWNGSDPEKRWTAEHLALLGGLPDEEVARRTGRTEDAVRQKREKLGIPNPDSNRWAAEEIALLGTLPDQEVGRKVGRSTSVVTQKRIGLGIPLACDRRRRESRA
jgi:hypothetical protein